MGQIVRLLCGQWTKNDEREWIFTGDPNEVEHFIVANTNEKFESFLGVVRQELQLPPTKPLILTYRLPESMMEGRTIREPPHTILKNEDVELLMSIQEWKNDMFVSVTSGPLGVAKFQFLCRTPFTIGDTTYLGDGISDEDHLAAINDKLDEEEFICNGRVLRELFSEEKLLLLYRFSFEIEKAKQMSHVKKRQSKEARDAEENISNLRPGGLTIDPTERPRISTYCEQTFGDMQAEPHAGEDGGIDRCDEIINLSSDLNMEDALSPMSENDYADIDGSSTGSAPAEEGFTSSENRGLPDQRRMWGKNDADLIGGKIHNGMERRERLRDGNELPRDPIQYISIDSDAELEDSLVGKNPDGIADDRLSGIRVLNGL